MESTSLILLTFCQSTSTFTTKDGLAHSIVRSIVQDREGHLWFATSGGVSRYDGQTFTTFTTQHGLAHNSVRSILQDREGLLWFGTLGGGVSRYDGQTFTTFTTKDGLAHTDVSSIVQDQEGSLWFGTVGGGVSRYDGQVFTTFTTKDGLASNNVRSIFQDREGYFWFGTDGGVTRYCPPASAPPPVFIDAVLADRRYEGVFDIAIPSSVELTMFEFRAISFKTRPEAMIYRYRLTGYEEDWTNTHTRRVEYQNLPRGTYTFEVQAVDRDLVYSKTPATLALTVHLPYERIGWMSALGIAVVLIGWQTVRVIRRDRRLSITNNALSDANRELFGLNRELQQERFVERIRGDVQAMEKAEDFDNLLSTLAENLKAVGLSFTTCGIEVLDEPVDKPTMEHFETHGFHYTAYTIDPEGIVSRESYPLAAPFPPVSRETIERFIAGEPWQGTSSNTAIVETPIAQYGRLRVTAPDRDTFSDDEIETLQDFATAIALGYTRYLDFVNLEAANKEIQIQTERKSAFLASMSHELRTPITAMKGFVDNILDGIGGKVNERHERSLTRVTHNASRLLDLVNNLLDLSKVEAGRMDVDVASFSVKSLISSCCGNIDPLVQSEVQVVQDIADEADEANTDEDKLRHIIGNLLSNAVKFTKEGEIAVRAKRVHDQLVISVSDTGVGMPKESLETIFDEFQQVDGSEQEQKGTGLGLAITKKYAELLEGTIFVDSEVGKGTTFTVQIPAIHKKT